MISQFYQHQDPNGFFILAKLNSFLGCFFTVERIYWCIPTYLFFAVKLNRILFV